MNKYNARKTEICGILFDSKAEANRYLVLLSREQQGEIHNLKVHPKFKIVEGFTDSMGNKQRPTYYIADFEYYTNGGRRVVEDVKGGRATQTAVFKLKKKLFLREYPGVDFRVVTT